MEMWMESEAEEGKKLKGKKNQNGNVPALHPHTEMVMEGEGSEWC